MTDAPFISVVIPVYNVKAYLYECLTSVVSQTYHNYEIIIIDDGSTDGSSAICDDFQVKYPNLIKVIHKPNGGLSSARNRGIEIASGQYIGFVDSDDFVPCDMLENLVSGFALDDNAMIVNGMIKAVDENGQNEREMRPEQWHRESPRIIRGKDFGISMFVETSNHYVWSKLYDARLFCKVRFVEGRNDEDTLFAYDLAKIFRVSNYSMVEIPESTCYYRQNPTSICNNTKTPHFRVRLKNLEELIEDSISSMPELNTHLHKLYTKSLIWWLKKMARNPEWQHDFIDYSQKLKLTDMTHVFQSINTKDFCFYLLSKEFPRFCLGFLTFLHKNNARKLLSKPLLLKNGR